LVPYTGRCHRPIIRCGTILRPLKGKRQQRHMICSVNENTLRGGDGTEFMQLDATFNLTSTLICLRAMHACLCDTFLGVYRRTDQDVETNWSQVRAAGWSRRTPVVTECTRRRHFALNIHAIATCDIVDTDNHIFIVVLSQLLTWSGRNHRMTCF